MIKKMRYEELYAVAKEALENAYAPYSNYKVGAAVLTQNGEVFTGVNIENASYGATICAERVAVSKAVSDGKLCIVAIAIALENDEIASPCGICRQFIFEFGDDVDIIVGKDEGHLIVRPIKDLLPEGFRL